MKTKHTPGPWKAVPFNNPATKETGFGISSETDGVVAWVYQSSPNVFGRQVLSSLPAEANALLIAASADMLFALKMAITQLSAEVNGPLYFVVRDTIAKAEGDNG